jgi:zinc protease
MIRPFVFVLFTVTLAAQDPSDKGVPLSKMERKNLAPVSKELLKVKLPKPVEAKLDNGLTVLVLEDHRLPSISAQLLIRGAGGLSDPANMPGLAGATATMLKEGTTTRSSKQIAEEIDGLGANLNAGTGFGTLEATVSGSGLSDNFDKWFGLMTDVLLHPSFPDGELQKYKQRQIVGLKQQRTQPTFLSGERFSKAVYGDFPAAIVSTTPEALQAMTSETLAKWHHERYVPQNAILAIAGDVDPKQLIAKLNKSLAEWKGNDFVATVPPSPVAVKEKQIYLVNRPGSVQTNLVLGNIAIDRRSPDYFAYNVMNRILGGGAAGRLFINLREEKGYTYGAYSSFAATEFAGPWRATAEVRTPVTEGSMVEFLKEFNRLRNEKVPASELDEATRSIVATFALSLEQPTQVLSYATTRKVYNLPADYWDTYPAKITAVTADDVMRVAKKYINPDNLQVVAVGDASVIKPVLEKFGPVTVYGADGKPVTP